MEFLNANQALPGLLEKVLNEGALTDSRNGRTRELTMQQVTLFDPSSQLEITTEGRKVSLPAQIAETMWILAGRNDIGWLSHYLPRAAEFADDGERWRGGYGPRLRQWLGMDQDNGKTRWIDQLDHVVQLINGDPETRRAVLNIYDPSIDTEPGKDIPCNNWVHLLPRDGALHAHVAIRSNDLFWGWSGINAFEWSSLLTVVAGLTNLRVGSITFSISSLHLYERHWAKAEAIVEQHRTSGFDSFERPSPAFVFNGTLGQFDDLVARWFETEALIRDEDSAERDIMSAINSFPEPMLQSWLWVLYAWNAGDMDILSMMGFEGTPLYAAAAASPKRKLPEPPAPLLPEDREGFTKFALDLHAEKHAAYGNSWKKRGEMLGIMANIARKVDRLGVAGGGDTSADTAIDLLMYLVKYSLWLAEQEGNSGVEGAVNYTEGQEHLHRVAAVVGSLIKLPADRTSNEELISTITGMFDNLEHMVAEKRADRADYLARIMELAYPLAVRLWTEEQDGALVDIMPKVPSLEQWKADNAKRRFDGYNA